MSEATPQPPEKNRVQLAFGRDAEGLHSPVLLVTDGEMHMPAKLTPDQAENIAMTLMELALECRKANSAVLVPPPPPQAA